MKSQAEIIDQFREIGTGYSPFPNSPQIFFHIAPWSEGLFGGAAGGGKSETLINDPVPDLLRYPGTTALYLRREYPMLEDIVHRMQELFTPLGAVYNEGKHRFTFPNGSRYYLGHMQKEMSKLRYQGQEFGIINFDELTHFTESQYLYLLSRNRSKTLPEHRWRMRSGTNPGGPGHAWVKRRFIDALEPNTFAHFYRHGDEEFMVPSDFPYSRSRFWVPSKVSDNPIYAGGFYEANLRALPEEERRMLLEGDWGVFSGQFFTTWRKILHVIEPLPLSHLWEYFGGMDYGEKSPLCYLIVAVDLQGNAFVVDEYYNVEKDRSIEEHCEIIKAMEAKLPKKVKRRVGDWNIFSAVTRDYKVATVETIDNMFQKRGITLTRANKDRLAGWRLMKEYLDWKSIAGDTVYRGPESIAKRPRLHIFQNCRNLIRTLPDMMYDSSEGAKRDERRASDLDTLGEDHAVDTLRYILMHLGKATLKKPIANNSHSGYIEINRSSNFSITYR